MRLQVLGKLGCAAFDFDRARLPFVSYFVAATSVAGFIISVFRWPLVSVLTVFLEPLIEVGAFGLFGIALVWAFIHAIVPLRGFRKNRFSPLLLGLVMLCVFFSFHSVGFSLRWILQ